VSRRNRSQERPEASSAVPASLPRSSLFALLILQTGVVLCVLVLVPLPGVCLYSEPKELVVDLVGLTAASFCLVSACSIDIDWADLFLGLLLVFSILSACLAATDTREALRTVGMTISGVAVFWSSRRLARQNQRQPLLDAAAIAVVLVSVTIIIDSFGYGLSFPNGSSRGTLGNRNWAAHLLAIGMPLLALASLSGKTSGRRVLGLCALGVTTAALVLTRSRAGWLAALLSTVLPLAFLAANSRLFRATASVTRGRVALSALLAGVVLGIAMPTRLHWSSPNPYLESAESIAAYDQGSGRFRLRQYDRSLMMVADHLALGVGPGNWVIVYPTYLPNQSPLGIWYPRRANSDWITLAAERGVPAAIFFFSALVSLGIGSWRSFISLRQAFSCSERSLEPLCGIAILTSLVVVGSLDAVLQLAAPTFVFYLALGALVPQQKAIASLALTPRFRTLAIVTTLLIGAALGLYLLDEMYTVFLIARARGDDLELASWISFDPAWFHNEKLWFSFRREIMGAKGAAGHP
jgi:putative inorganic carbon (hco3(-)) transporter